MSSTLSTDSDSYSFTETDPYMMGTNSLRHAFLAGQFHALALLQAPTEYHTSKTSSPASSLEPTSLFGSSGARNVPASTSSPFIAQNVSAKSRAPNPNSLETAIDPLSNLVEDIRWRMFALGKSTPSLAAADFMRTPKTAAEIYCMAEKYRLEILSLSEKLHRNELDEWVRQIMEEYKKSETSNLENRGEKEIVKEQSHVTEISSEAGRPENAEGNLSDSSLAFSLGLEITDEDSSEEEGEDLVNPFIVQDSSLSTEPMRPCRLFAPLLPEKAHERARKISKDGLISLDSVEPQLAQRGTKRKAAGSSQTPFWLKKRKDMHPQLDDDDEEEEFEKPAPKIEKSARPILRRVTRQIEKHVEREVEQDAPERVQRAVPRKNDELSLSPRKARRKVATHSNLTVDSSATGLGISLPCDVNKAKNIFSLT